MPLLKTCLKNIEHFFFPATCALCGKPGEDGRELCTECLTDLPYNAPACKCCALLLPDSAGAETLCGQCQKAPPAYDRALSLLQYTYPVDHLIQRLKFNAKLHLAGLLGELMAERLGQRTQALPELLIPVPLHSSRLRARGFNQALELARPIARRLGLALDYRSCARLRATAVQSSLAAKDKRANVKGAFGVVKTIKARHVAIIDDVMTTGHTVEEFAGVLRKAGVTTIEVWVLARTARSG